jgi:hypothetical protein
MQNTTARLKAASIVDIEKLGRPIDPITEGPAPDA